jgi:hypothetical protein
MDADLRSDLSAQIERLPLSPVHHRALARLLFSPPKLGRP